LLTVSTAVPPPSITPEAAAAAASPWCRATRLALPWNT